jgi:hypothetical protein
MDDTRSLIADMAAKCQFVIRGSNEEEEKLPKALHPKHLLWMCEQIRRRAHASPVTRLHRWIGFVQAGILANRMLDLEQIRAMFDEVKKSHSLSSEDRDLIDHLDVDSSFRFDIGGQG